MNTSLNKTFTLLVLAIGFALPSVHAQETAPAEVAPKGRAKAGHAMDALADLNLTPEQKSKVDAIRKDEHSALSTLKAYTAAGEADKRNKRKEITDSHQAQIRAVLTPDQQAKFDALPKTGARASKAKSDQPKE